MTTPTKSSTPPTRGIETAPSWGVSEWLNLTEGKKRLDIGDYKGKVIYLYGFQSWCPGCHRAGFPTLKHIIEKLGEDPDVAIVAVQTTFEGFQSNDINAAKEIIKRYDLKIPVGQSGSANERSLLMQRYRTGGTPWVIIIDRSGIVRFNNFHIEPAQAVNLIEELKKKKGSMESEK